MAKGNNTKIYLPANQSMPWEWRLEPVFDDPSTPHHCPAPSRLFGLFALLNIFTFVFTLLFAHRPILHRLLHLPHYTSHAPSLPRQLLVPVAAAGLQVLTIFFTTLIINSKPGYSFSPSLVGEVILLFVSLPRLDWALLIPASYPRTPITAASSRDIYTSATINALRRDVLLLLVSQPIWYRTAIRGNSRGFYKKGSKLRPATKGMFNAAMAIIVFTFLMVPLLLRLSRKLQLAHRWAVLQYPSQQPDLPNGGEDTGARAIEEAVKALEDEVKARLTLRERWQRWRWRGWSEKRGMERVREKQEGDKDFAVGILAKWVWWVEFAVWVCQWVWWVGFVKVERDRFCPPKSALPVMGVVMAMGQLLGISIGALG